MNDKAQEVLAGYFDPETGEEDWREILSTAPAGYRDTAQSGWAELLRVRNLSLKEFYALTRTDLEIETEDEMYAEIAKAYELLFDEPAPPYQGSSSE